MQQMNQVKLDDPNAPESALSSLKKDMQSLSLNERREEKHSEPHTDGFLVVDRHKKRAKGSNEGTESKKMKPEVQICVLATVRIPNMMTFNNLSIQ